MNPELARLLRHELFGNDVAAYLTAAAAFAVALSGAYLARRVLVSRLSALAQRTATALDDLFVEALASIRGFEFFILSLFVATRGLALHGSIDRLLRIALVVALSVRGLLILQLFAAYGIGKYAELEVGDPTARSALRNLQRIVNAALWVAGALFILGNLGVNVSAFMTGLGIGGIAIALAAQTVLGDLFSSFSILMDKPFRVGDAIAVGELVGTVEHVGIKTTRVRSVNGELLVFANSQLTSSTIRNFGWMQERRVVLQLGVVCQTPAEKLRTVPKLVRRAVEGVAKTRFDRAHFHRFGDSSLDFEAVYFVEGADYNFYMDCREKVNLAVFESFAKEGLEFAYPTRTLFVEKLPAA